MTIIANVDRTEDDLLTVVFNETVPHEYTYFHSTLCETIVGDWQQHVVSGIGRRSVVFMRRKIIKQFETNGVRMKFVIWETQK